MDFDTEKQEPDISLVMPCYNEEESIAQTAPELVEVFTQGKVNLELILVNNGSRDRTGAIIDTLIDRGLPVVKVTVKVNQGYGYGILCGLERCQGRLVGYLCADGQVEAQDVYRVYQLARAQVGPCLVKVRRRFRADSLVRKVISCCYNVLINLLFRGLHSWDVNGSPKIFPRELLQPLALGSQDWFLDPELMIKIKLLDLPVKEINVIGRLRRGGKSQVRPVTCVEFLRSLYEYRFCGALDNWRQEQSSRPRKALAWR